jgi:hypothetical protein
MVQNKQSGDFGEKEIIKLIKCPNCKRKMMLMPVSFPLVDIQCTACNFRAQVKTANSKPKDEIFGAGWEIMNKTSKAGYLIPPLITNFKWEGHQEIYFSPFIPRENIKMRILPPTAKRANYKMFNYVGLKKLPKFILYKK